MFQLSHLKILTATLLIASSIVACDVTKEGDACNALLTSPQQCDPGIVCTTPDNCTSAACCPADAASTNPNCQACPAVDAGSVSDATTDGGG